MSLSGRVIFYTVFLHDSLNIAINEQTFLQDLGNLEEMFHWHYVQSDVMSRF